MIVRRNFKDMSFPSPSNSKHIALGLFAGTALADPSE